MGKDIEVVGVINAKMNIHIYAMIVVIVDTAAIVNIFN